MKRSILGLMYLIQGMRQTEIDIDARLASIGLQADALDPSSIIHPSVERAIQNVIAKDVDPLVGLMVGQHYALAGYGPLLMLLVTSQTVYAAVQNGVRFQGLTHLSGILGSTINAQEAALTYQSNELLSDTDLFRAHCEISGTYKFIKDIYQMVGLEIPQIRVELPFDAPDDPSILQRYQYYYGNNIHFGAEQAVFWFDQELLDFKLPSADVITFRVYEAKCVAEIARLNEEEEILNPLIDRVQNYLELQKGILPTMTETAFALNIPERTLRHQLQQLNTSYKEIREQLMKHKALRLIEYKEYSIEVIAEMLGYSEPAAFNHAFKRWFGQSPRQYGK